jgi:pimeloyl-ACP methyl ester carboxylesterase
MRIETRDAELIGDLAMPERARGLVLFAHGSGSSRKSPRNRFVAEKLGRHALATLLFDLLTPAEEDIDIFTREHRFDIALLATRLTDALVWAKRDARCKALPVGLFGASTGAAAALVTAAVAPRDVQAVVSRGGRPDLAGDYLAKVTAPTLLIVGGRDDEVLELNQAASRELGGPSEIVIVEGATHLFEEPFALEEVARLAGEHFDRHLR